METRIFIKALLITIGVLYYDFKIVLESSSLISEKMMLFHLLVNAGAMLIVYRYYQLFTDSLKFN